MNTTLAEALHITYPDIFIGADPVFSECVLGGENILYWGRPESQPDESTLISSIDPDDLALFRQEHGEDIELTRRRRARDIVNGPVPVSVETRAELGERNKRDNYLANRIVEIQETLTAMKSTSGPAQDLRDAIPDNWLPTGERAREDARKDLLDEIDSGDSDK